MGGTSLGVTCDVFLAYYETYVGYDWSSCGDSETQFQVSAGASCCGGESVPRCLSNYSAICADTDDYTESFYCNYMVYSALNNMSSVTDCSATYDDQGYLYSSAETFQTAIEAYYGCCGGRDVSCASSDYSYSYSYGIDLSCADDCNSSCTTFNENLCALNCSVSAWNYIADNYCASSDYSYSYSYDLDLSCADDCNSSCTTFNENLCALNCSDSAYDYIAENFCNVSDASTSLTSDSPTKYPVPVPTTQPVPIPTVLPTQNPAAQSVPAPTTLPKTIPTTGPTKYPVPVPTTQPVHIPTVLPTQHPAAQPVPAPTASPKECASDADCDTNEQCVCVERRLQHVRELLFGEVQSGGCSCMSVD